MYLNFGTTCHSDKLYMRSQIMTVWGGLPCLYDLGDSSVVLYTLYILCVGALATSGGRTFTLFT